MPEKTCISTRCRYTWLSRKQDPKTCPRCKRRQDMIYKRKNILHKIADLMDEEVEMR